MNIATRYAVGFFVLAAVAPQFALAQTASTSKFIVPFPPGGTGDVIARLFAQQMQTPAQSFVVENRPGASTIIATEQVLRAPPDGTTLLEVANAFVINPSLRTLTFDPFSFEPVCLMASSPQVLVVASNSPYRSFAEFLAAAKTKPGEFSYASVGPATTPHIIGEMLRRSAQIDLNYVPFPGGAPAVNSLLGGHVTAVMANLSEIMEHAGPGGKLRPLVTAAGTRLRELPDVPTLKEAGFDLEGSAWFGMVAPPKTPKDTIEKLSAQFTAALQAPDVQSKLSVQGLYAGGLCGAQFGAFLRNQYEVLGKVIRDVNMKPPQ